ncbi:MAG: DUF4160 domain-containing protein [Comamonadaceae bacterium]
MGTIYKTGKFTIRVNGFEHPPVHAHVTHTDGRAMVYLNGMVKNTGVPESVMNEAKNWIAANSQSVIDEWNICNPKE